MGSLSVLGSALREARLALREQPVFAGLNEIRDVAKALYEGINTPLSLKLRDSLLCGDVDALAHASVDPSEYQDADAYYIDVCAVSFLRKFDSLGGLGYSALDPEGAAKRTFVESEQACRATNELFRGVEAGAVCLDPYVSRVLRRTRTLIKDTLGKCPEFSSLELRFGPGVTSACKGDRSTIADKLLAFPECTLDAVPAVQGLQVTHPMWHSLIGSVHPSCMYNAKLYPVEGPPRLIKAVAPRIVRGNTWTCVPKDAKTHRGICVEPHTNSCFQLAIGSLLTARLSRVGIVKELQQTVNREFARIGSLTGEFATVDLRAASDTISLELVRYLLPYDWFVLLSTFRSPETLFEGEWRELEKFSSMGNGYTFELETLIFYALARANAYECRDASPVTVFGDDIICSSQVVSPLVKVLNVCGFVVNTSKSFWTGRFRESCGADYFDGVMVRPYFLKECPTDALDWTTLANGIRRMGSCNDPDAGLDPRFVRAWLRCISYIPKPLRCWGPVRDTDAWLHTERREDWTVRYDARKGILCQYGFVRRTREVSWDRYCGHTRLAAALYGSMTWTPLSLRGRGRDIKLRRFEGVQPF